MIFHQIQEKYNMQLEIKEKHKEKRLVDENSMFMSRSNGCPKFMDRLMDEKEKREYVFSYTFLFCYEVVSFFL